MKSRSFYIVMLPLVMIISAFIIIKKSATGTTNKTAVYQLLPRKVSLIYPVEWETAKKSAADLAAKIKRNPADTKSLAGLATLYIQEGRITGNFTYYNKAALQLVDEMLKADPNNFEALTLKATILLSEHQFEEGKEIAEQALRLFPQNAYVYGLLVDANVELGYYDAALDAADKMISIRPDLRSYSRVAYLREIYGDIPGAIEAMKMAVDAGSPGDENTEWCRVQLAKLYLQTGNLPEAKMYFTMASDNRKNYAFALAGLASIASEEGDYSRALLLYMQADSLIADRVFKEGIAETYKLAGQEEAAKKITDEMEKTYPAFGISDKAVLYAKKEYERRPLNTGVNESLAIIYYQRGEYDKALPYIETALKTKCKNPELLCYAGLIYGKTGDKVNAKLFLQQALKDNPVISQKLKKESRQFLMSLT